MDLLATDKPDTSEKELKGYKLDKKKLVARHAALVAERNTWMPHWRELSEHQRPWGFREYRSDVNKGTKRHGKIINFTPLEAARTLASGMMAGITSPSRPWFRLTLKGSPELSENPEVKAWLNDVERRIRDTLAKSNAYKGLHLVYSDLGPFGTSCFLLEEDNEEAIRAYVFPVGSYCLAASERGNIDTVFRDVSLTVDQMVRLFGEKKCSEQVRRMHKEGQYDARIDVVHAIFPNPDFKEGMLGPAGKRYLSCWWEAKAPTETGFLRVSGYNDFPAMAPRWEVTGEDVYGHGPGMAALGDCKALQLLEKRGAQAADKHINPPMSAPSSAKSSPISLLPGEVNYVDGLGAGQALRPAVQADPRAIEVIELQKREYEKRIRKAFFADLWLLLSESTGVMTAREVSERREEKLLQLGAVLEALMDELLSPLIERIFTILLRRGDIPPAPEALQGKDLSVEFVSIMAQAQKLLATTGLERAAAFVGNLAAVKPDVLDKMDFDQLVDEYADSLGIPPATVRTDEDVAKLRALRAKQQQQQVAVQQAAEGAKAAKDLANSDLESNNALTEMLRGVGVR